MKRTFVLILLCLLLCGACQAAQASEPASAPLQTSAASRDGMVRVWLSSIRDRQSYTLTLTGPYTLAGQTLTAGTTVKVEFSGGSVYVTANGLRTNMGTSATLVRGSGGARIAESLAPDNTYPGDFQFFVQSGVSYVVCALHIEDYVYGVLPYEMDNSFPLEALKAQAVAARTYAARVSASSLYDVTDTITHQVFRGVNYGKARCIQATDETKGVVMLYNGSLIDANFGASNGGQTELNSNAWGSTRAGYLQSKNDPYDLANPQSVEKSYFIYRTPAQGASVSAYALMQDALALHRGGLASAYAIESVENVSFHTPKYASPSRVYTQMSVTVRYNGGQMATVDIPVFPTVKTGLGLSINSTNNELFSVETETNGFRVTARRYGHGVGMSQRGAQQMANLGFDYRQILNFYFTGIQLEQRNYVGGSTQAPGGGATPGESTPGVTGEQEGRVSLANASSRLNLRQSPDANGTVIGRLAHGAAVTVTGESGTWYQVRYGTLVGYVAKSYVVLQQQTAPGTSGDTAYIVTQSGYVSIRAEARATAVLVGSVLGGVEVTVLERGDIWCKIQAGGTVGYVLTANLMLAGAGTSSGDADTATVTLQNIYDQLNLRLNPSTTAPVLAGLAHGSKLTVVERGATWSKVSVQGLTGYVINQYITFAGESAAPTPTAAPGGTQTWPAVVVLQSGTLNLRSQPSVDGYRLTGIPNGAAVTVTQLGEGWCGISYGGYEGYVLRKYLYVSEAQSTLPPAATPTPAPTGLQAGDAWIKTESGGGVNLRSTASLNGGVICAIPYGAQVQVVEPDAQWAYVRYGMHSGYVASAYLSTQKPGDVAVTAAPPAQAESYAYVKTASGGPVNLRREASANSGIIGTLAHGTKVQLLEAGSAWSHVSTGDAAGYVASQYLSQTAPAGAGSGSLPSISGSAVNTGQVRTGGGAATLYGSPDTASSAVASLAEGTTFTVYQYTGAYAKWLYVRTDTALGYLERTGVRLDRGIASVSLSSLDGTLSMYELADDTANVVAVLQQGEIVTVLSEDASWAQVRTTDGITGYVWRHSIGLL